MKKLCAMAVLLSAAIQAQAVCEVSDVTLEQGARSRLATVTYTLSGDGASIVTLQICTNAETGACLKETDFSVSGELGRKIVSSVAGERHSATVTFSKALKKGGLPAGASAIVKAWAPDDPPPVLVIDPKGTAENVRFYAATNDFAGFRDRCYKDSLIALVRVPAKGGCVLGSPETQNHRGADESQHHVTFTEDFYIGVYPVTVAQYAGWMGSAPRAWSGLEDFDIFPVFGVSYDMLRGTSVDWPETGHAVSEESALGILRNRTGIAFDLPTEAQWEFAARAGAETANWNGSNDDAHVREIGYSYSSAHEVKNQYGRDRYPWAVGALLASPFGLHDVIGNCFEWCLDRYGAYSALPSVDPAGPASGSTRVCRGGYFGCDYYDCTSSRRTERDPSNGGNDGDYADAFGFRLACPASF